MNPGTHGRDLRRVFDTPEYQVMLVAMYLDKKISGVEAVQTPSGLNHTHPGKDQDLRDRFRQ